MKRKWIIVVVIAVLISAAGFLRFHHTSPSRRKNYYEGLDESDSLILEEALSYIATCPSYKSAYYEGGYPNDGYGTCVDVVGIALRNSGYDLRMRVDEDIRSHPERYDIETPDANIDFRRVRNLIVYFQNNEEVLTNDLYELSAWQAGDIVIFRNHIGIVSDRRNSNGVPYVIHHSSPYQLWYEEDILEKRDDLVLHVRVNIS
ncbi:MAG: DUF1287 domain-containing protein [Solobacterium sp.]|nr:DUF1287 domain-containing protein [Solobacterium sp.]